MMTDIQVKVINFDKQNEKFTGYIPKTDLFALADMIKKQEEGVANVKDY